MAERRMFSKSVVLSDTFLDLSKSAMCLYFILGMNADDEGFVSSPKSVMRQCATVNDDMKTLVNAGFVIPFESGVIVIRHWKRNNYIQSDRLRETVCTDEKAQIQEDENRVYSLVDKPCIQNGYKTDTGYSIGKNSIDKNTITDTASPSQTPTLEEIEDYCKRKGINVNPKRFYDTYTKSGWHTKDGKLIDDWYALIENWGKTEKPKKTKASEHKGSFETDDFFEAALRRSYEDSPS